MRSSCVLTHAWPLIGVSGDLSPSCVQSQQLQTCFNKQGLLEAVFENFMRDVFMRMRFSEMTLTRINIYFQKMYDNQTSVSINIE